MTEDRILEAIKEYRLTASDEQKRKDLERLENECQSDVDAESFLDYCRVKNQRDLWSGIKDTTNRCR